MTRHECLSLLQVDVGVSLDDLREARRRMLLRYHPDHNPGREPWAATQVRLVLEAYEVLRKGGTGPAQAPRGSQRSAAEPERRAATAPPAAREQGGATVGDRLREMVERKRQENESRKATRSVIPEVAFILFTARDLVFGLPVGHVVEIVQRRSDSITPVAGGRSHPGYLGRMNYRDTIVPVVDLAEALEIGGDDPGIAHVVVVDAHGARMGLAVSKVREVTAVRPSAIEPPRASVTKHRQCLRGVFVRDGEDIYIPDVDAMVGLFE